MNACTPVAEAYSARQSSTFPVRIGATASRSIRTAVGSCLARCRTASGRLITSATARPCGGARRAVSAGTPGRCWAASRTVPAARPAAGTAAFLPGVVLPGVLRPVRDGPPAAPAEVLAVRGLLAVRGAPAVLLAVLAAVAVLAV